MRPHPLTQIKQQGFTLLELILVIATISVLGSVVFVAINPTEALRKTRDAQRIADLDSLKGALEVYTTNAATVDLDGTAYSDLCFESNNGNVRIAYSVLDPGESCVADIQEGADVVSGSTFDSGGFCAFIFSGNLGATDGSGWLPVNFNSLPGGSPIKRLPVDPVNTIGTLPQTSALVYRYVCQNANVPSTTRANIFEIDAQLESKEYTVTHNKRTSDGGDNNNYYEVGTSLKLLGNSVQSISEF